MHSVKTLQRVSEIAARKRKKKLFSLKQCAQTKIIKREENE